MNKPLLLALCLLGSSACVFSDLGELPPPITVVNNTEPDLSEDLSGDGDMDTADMPVESCALDPRSLTSDAITHFAADRFVDVVFYAVRLANGGIRLGRIEGETLESSYATTSLPGTGVHAISIAAVGPDQVLVAILADEERVVRMWSCASDGCTSFGTIGVQGVAEMQLAGGDPPLLGFVRGIVPNQEFVAQGIDLAMDALIPGQVLRATRMEGIEGVSFAAGAGGDYRIAFGSPLNGFYTGFGTGPLDAEKCLTFEKRQDDDTYFTRVKRLNDYFLLRADGLFLTNCEQSLQLTARRAHDADVVPLSGQQAFALWTEVAGATDRVRGSLIEAGEVVRSIEFGEWEQVEHVRAFRTASELMVFFGGEGTHLQLIQESPLDLAMCFQN